MAKKLRQLHEGRREVKHMLAALVVQIRARRRAKAIASALPAHEIHSAPGRNNHGRVLNSGDGEWWMGARSVLMMRGNAQSLAK
jgi:hypothetical protein